jgi:hypothetical protein
MDAGEHVVGLGVGVRDGGRARRAVLTHGAKPGVELSRRP